MLQGSNCIFTMFAKNSASKIEVPKDGYFFFYLVFSDIQDIYPF